MRAVLDTNVIVSAILSRSGAPDAILRSWRRGRFQLITSLPLLRELEDVLARPSIARRTGFSRAEAAAFVQALADTAIVVATTADVSVLADAADNRLLEAAVAARADYIVSGDRAVLALETYENSQTITPARFLAILSSTAEAP